jgi:hypothetical protein
VILHAEDTAGDHQESGRGVGRGKAGGDHDSTGLGVGVSVGHLDGLTFDGPALTGEVVGDRFGDPVGIVRLNRSSANVVGSLSVSIGSVWLTSNTLSTGT